MTMKAGISFHHKRIWLVKSDKTIRTINFLEEKDD
jgi:hypothetical protein